jgi:hypothetical protein
LLISSGFTGPFGFSAHLLPVYIIPYLCYFPSH